MRDGTSLDSPRNRGPVRAVWELFQLTNQASEFYVAAWQGVIIQLQGSSPLWGAAPPGARGGGRAAERRRTL